MESILEGIGHTPLLRLRRCAPANGAELWLKLVYRNPTGSMKDRMALAMIEGAERDGLISPGATVVEYTGGSYCSHASTARCSTLNGPAKEASAAARLIDALASLGVIPPH